MQCSLSVHRCRRHGIAPVRATQSDVAAYIRALSGIDPSAEKVRAMATIERYVSYMAQSAPSCDFGQVGERFGNVAFGIDDGNHRRGQFAPS